MKAKFIREMLYISVWLLLLLTTLSGSLLAQAPIYRFQNPTLYAGSDRQVGAHYRFSNVTTGVDALVSIDSMSAGISLQNIDRTLDGYGEAFQPEYRINNGREGQILFSIVFVKAGTSLPLLQPLVDASGLDIDGSTSGGRMLMEMNGIDMGGGVCTFDASGSHIVVSQVDKEYVGRNITGFLYGALVDTAASQVMYTVTHGNISSMKYRVGANNQTGNNSTRYASLYFKRFIYPDMGVLSTPVLKNFSGLSREQRNELNWELMEDNQATTVTLERAYGEGKDFQTVAEFWVNMEGSQQRVFRFADVSYNKEANAVLYRLKLLTRDGKIQYSSVVRFNTGLQRNESKLQLYPTQVQDGMNLQLRAGKAETGRFEVYDLGGKLIYQQALQVQAGNNNIRMNTLDGIPRGHFVSVVRTSEGLFSARFSKL